MFRIGIKLKLYSNKVFIYIYRYFMTKYLILNYIPKQYKYQDNNMYIPQYKVFNVLRELVFHAFSGNINKFY